MLALRALTAASEVHTRTTMPSCAGVVHEVWRATAPSISTRHMRQAPTGTSFS